MQRRKIFKVRNGWIMVLCLVLGLSAQATASSLATVRLQDKMIEITDLREKIIDKMVQAFEVRSMLQEQVREYTQEIHQEMKTRRLDTYQTASRIQRIRNNLFLIQKIDGYLVSLEKRIAYFQDGSEQLEFLYLQAEDDLRIIEALKYMEVEALLHQMQVVIGEYLPEAEKRLLDARQVVMTAPEEVWDRLVDTN